MLILGNFVTHHLQFENELHPHTVPSNEATICSEVTAFTVTTVFINVFIKLS